MCARAVQLYNFNILILPCQRAITMKIFPPNGSAPQTQWMNITTRSAYRARPAAVAAILHKILMKFLCDDDIFVILDFFTLSLHSYFTAFRTIYTWSEISSRRGRRQTHHGTAECFQNTSKIWQLMANNGYARINIYQVSLGFFAFKMLPQLFERNTEMMFIHHFGTPDHSKPIKMNTKLVSTNNNDPRI